jgi:hypothetical protein
MKKIKSINIDVDKSFSKKEKQEMEEFGNDIANILDYLLEEQDNLN